MMARRTAERRLRSVR